MCKFYYLTYLHVSVLMSTNFYGTRMFTLCCIIHLRYITWQYIWHNFVTSSLVTKVVTFLKDFHIFRACAQCDSLPRVVKEPKPRRAWQSNIFYCKSMPSDRFPEHTKQIASRQNPCQFYTCMNSPLFCIHFHFERTSLFGLPTLAKLVPFILLQRAVLISRLSVTFDLSYLVHTCPK